MEPTEATGGRARLLEIRTLEVVSGKGRSFVLSTVRCPARGRSTPVEECAHCDGSDGVAQDALARGAYLACRGPLPEGRPGSAPGGHTPVADVMRRAGVAVRAGVGRAVAADALRTRGIATAPVVDGEGRPIGVVAESDLLRARSGAKVADAMTRVAIAVPEAAPIARAASLMATHRLDRVPVVAPEGVVVGVLSASDVIAWLAGAGGPLAPADAPPAQPA
jgi:CBS domain-containing protein